MIFTSVYIVSMHYNIENNMEIHKEINLKSKLNGYINY